MTASAPPARDATPRSSQPRGTAAVPLLLSCLLLAATALVQMWQPAALATLQNTVFDQYQRWRPRPFEPAPVRIVDVDDASLARLGQWPWPRTRIASMVEQLFAHGAAVVAFDVVFAEPDRTSPAQVAKEWRGTPELDAVLSGLPDHDAVLARTIANGGVITGFALSRDASDDADVTPPAHPFRIIAVGTGFEPFLPRFTSVVRTLPDMERAAAGNGALTFLSSSDGVVRELPLLLRLGDTVLPALALEALRVAQGVRNVTVYTAGATDGTGTASGVAAVKVGALEISTAPDGKVRLYFGTPRADRFVPAWQVIAGNVDRALLENHIVFVGTSAKGLMDLRFSPLGGIVPGVEVQAQFVEQALQGSSLVRPDWAPGSEILFTLITGGLLTILLTRLRALWGAAVALACIGVAVAGSWHLFAAERLLLDPLAPSMALVAVFLIGSVPRAIGTEREQRWIKGAFSRYVSPNLVQHLVDNPGQLEVGGERRECSFIFTDLAGFTTFMERVDPADAVELLNTYLDRMIAIAFRHDGTLDRIVGDAVAIVFSAPVAQDDHAQRAMICALDMDRFAREFEKEKHAEGLALGITRIGVHGGTVIVGNFGGSTIFDYRALGDPVNTAARLETVNKHLGTRMCVSSAIVDHCPDFVGRPVGTLVLKGKSQGIEAYEPLSARDPAYEKAFSLMAEGNPDTRDAFAALAGERPDDGLVRFHLARLERGESGITVVMSEK